MRHRFALAGLIAGLLFATSWVVAFAAIGATRVAEGDNVLVVFPADVNAARIIGRLDATTARQFAPAGFGNAWIVQAGSDARLARALRDDGALLVLQATGPLHFALGCTTGAPLR